MLRQNTAITVEDKQRLMPFIATPRGEILFDGPAWIATLMGNKTNGGGTTAMLSILARLPELAPNGRRLTEFIDRPLDEPSYICMDDRVFFTPEATKTVVDYCNSGRLNKTFYKKDGTSLTETHDHINAIRNGMRDLVDTMCATIRRRVVAVAEVAEQLVGVPVYPQPLVDESPQLVAASLDDAQLLVDAGAPNLDESQLPRIVAPNLYDAQLQHMAAAALGFGQLHLLDAGAPSLDEPMQQPQEQPVAASIGVQEPMQIDAPRRIEESLGAPPAAKVTLGASSIIPMGVADIFVECNGKQLALSFVTTEMQEVLIGGAAWIALIVGSREDHPTSSNVGAFKLADIVAKYPLLSHENRVLEDFSRKGALLEHFSYKYKKNIFLTIAGANESIEACSSGRLNKKHYIDQGETDVCKITAYIDTLKKYAMGILNMIETAIKARLEEQAEAVRNAPPKPVPFVPNGEDVSVVDKNAGGNDFFGGDIVKCERAVQLKKEAATIDVSKAKELASIELDVTEKRLSIERAHKRKEREEQKEIEENDPRFKKQRELDVFKMTMEVDTLRRVHDENLAIAEKAKQAAAKAEADRVKAEAKADADRAKAEANAETNRAKADASRAKAEAKAEADSASAELDQAFADFTAASGVKRAAPLLRLHEMLKQQFPHKSARTKFINQHSAPKAAKARVAQSDAFVAAEPSGAPGGIYVIEVEGKLPIKRYVGSSGNIKNRFRQHRDGNGGAACIQNATKYTMLKPSEMLTARLSNDEKLHQWEQRETLEQIYNNDIDSVYGGDFAMAGRTAGDVRAIFNGVCGHMDLCKKCGGKGHFASACRATNKAKWAGGGAI